MIAAWRVTVTERKADGVPRGLVLLLLTVISWCVVLLALRYGGLLLSLVAQLDLAMPVQPIVPRP